jgi:phosphatidylserine/phosphatidylglycerophosphate/cardiolipin synthase-like enzyme
VTAARIIERVDRTLGEGIEQTVRSHHRRRLARRGQRPLDAAPGGWAEGGSFPPRPDTQVELLVDGAEALPRMVADIAAAQSHVHLAGWFFSPDFRMGHGGPTLKELLGEAAERCEVRVLAWAGAPLPLFHPDRGEVRVARDELTRGTRIEMELDAKERPLHCHHEKLVIVDDRVAFVGGIDLTDFAGNRLDHSHHLPREAIGWHDACARLEGPIVADVAAHFALRWPRALPPSARPGEQADGFEAQLVRTVPEHVYDGLPNGEFTILESYVRALRGAQRLVYLENQFLWSPEIVEILSAKLRGPPVDDFRLVVLLPAKPNNGADDTRGQLGVLADAAVRGGDGRRFLACTLFQPGPTGGPVYVHAKIGIVDDNWLTIGSANLNEHSLFNDSEVNVVLRDEAFVRAARLRLWSEHLARPVAELEGDPCRIVDELWHAISEERSQEQKLRKLSHVSRRSRALLGPLNGLLVDG